MKAVVSTTYDSKYLFFLPIITWCWNKLGVDVICFMPAPKNITSFEGSKLVVDSTSPKFTLVQKTIMDNLLKVKIYRYDCPEHKEATYAQCSRLYASALDLPEDEILMTGDVDMAIFKTPFFNDNKMVVIGVDLVPKGQLPICYISGPVKEWRRMFNINEGYQQSLDALLGDIECENFRGNYWGKDQEVAYQNLVTPQPQIIEIPRARPGTQFALNRVDRDDINWRSYCGPDLIDAHLWRPGYTDENFANILELLQIQYPEDNFDWLKQYREQYIWLL